MTLINSQGSGGLLKHWGPPLQFTNIPLAAVWRVDSGHEGKPCRGLFFFLVVFFVL